MDHQSSAPSALFSDGILDTDDRLLDLSTSGDRSAIGKLWTRYYTAAFVAADSNPAHAGQAARSVIQGFNVQLGDSRKSADIMTFLTGWFAQCGSVPPGTPHRAIAWAFYGLPVRTRTILWRASVDRWSESQLITDLDLNPNSVEIAVEQANLQFADNVALASGLLNIRSDLALFRDTYWRSGALIAGILHSSPTDLDTRINPEKVIDPPVPHEIIPTRLTGSRSNNSDFWR